MNYKLYISDEGYGPIVRQSAIVEELRRLDPDASFVAQTESNAEAAGRILNDVRILKKYNLISWAKTPDGSPDIQAIDKFFSDYLDRSDAFIEEDADLHHNALISDFVYEAFEIGRRCSIPSFGVAHFTWDWFFSKLYPLPLSRKVLKRFFQYADQAKALYFPPFTPEEINKRYADKAVRVPLVVRKRDEPTETTDDDHFRILIMDSGSGLLYRQITRALDQIQHISDCRFYLSSAFNCQFDNTRSIDKNQLFLDYIPRMDLVIARAGFNTISECIACRTPMLLISEAMNPEMNENILMMKKQGLGSFISTEVFTENLGHFLSRFLQREYKNLREEMDAHTLDTNGAEVIAKDILDKLS